MSVDWAAARKAEVKQADFLLFNQQLSALLRAGIPVLQAIGLLKTRSAVRQSSSSSRGCRRQDQERCSALRGVRIAGDLSQGSIPHRSSPVKRAVLSTTSCSDLSTYLKRSVGVARKASRCACVPGVPAARGDVDGRVPDALHRSADVGPFQEPELRTAALPTITLVVLWFSNGIVEQHLRGSLPLSADRRAWPFRLAANRQAASCCCTRLLLKMPIAGTA